MNWLITGGCGFIGSRLIRKLLMEGHSNIRVVDNLSVGTKTNLETLTTVKDVDPNSIDSGPNDLELIVGDIKDAEVALKAGRGIDVVVHLAGNTGVGPSVIEPVDDCHNNVLGTLNYLESARHNSIGKFVFSSSGAPLGEVTPPIHEKLAPRPASPYGASKLACEGYCSAYANCYDVSTVVLRFGNVYGPGSGHKSSVVAKFISQAIKGERIEVYGTGKQTRDFIYIDDLVKAIECAVDTENISGEIFQIATNSETSIFELIDVLFPASGEVGIPVPELFHTDSRTGDVMRNYSDTSKANIMLGWNSSTDLSAGLKNTVAYFVSSKSYSG